LGPLPSVTKSDGGLLLVSNQSIASVQVNPIARIGWLNVSVSTSVESSASV
jgi:hypothetical protein